jgi:hypothetical protein
MLMLRLMMIIAVLIIAPVAQAEPVLLACHGEMRVLGPAGFGQAPESRVLSLAIDLRARTVTIEGYDPVPLPEPSDDDKVVFVNYGATVGVSTGAVNRKTGALWVHIIPRDGGLLGFEGVCKPAKKLF